MYKIQKLLSIINILIIQTLVLFSAGSTQTKMSLSRVVGDITFDGQVTEKAWDAIQPLTLTQFSPNYGYQPTEKTDILIGYDDQYLYIGGRLYAGDSADIQATSKKRDFMGGNTDWFGIILDTFSDNENGVAFFTTPTGLRFDATILNDANGEEPINLSWNTYWDVKISRNDEGWFTEMRIPFSSLRFQENNGVVEMGLIAFRWIPSKGEQIIFPLMPNDQGNWGTWKPSKAQKVILKGIPGRRPLYVTPYFLSGFGRSFELNDTETAYIREDDYELEPGLDLKYSLTSNLTLDVSVNTDFAQVEADDQQINLTRFSLFFPEKRQFFQERSSNFDFSTGGPNKLFYSRRIGIYDGQPVRIYGGGRIVGRIGAWDVGFLNMQTASIRDISSENYGVYRLRRQVINPNSYVGGIVTTRIGTDNSYNIDYGLDGIFRTGQDEYLKYYFAQTFNDSRKNNPLSLRPIKMGINWEKRKDIGFAYLGSLSYAGRDYDPGIGFQIRDNYTRAGGRMLYGWAPGESSSLYKHNIFLDGAVYFSNYTKEVESAELGPGWRFNFRSSAFGQITPKYFYEAVPDSFELSSDVNVPPGNYEFWGIQSLYNTPPGGLLFSMFILEAGTFYDGWRATLTASPTWSLSSDFELSGFYQLNRVVFPERKQDFYAHIARLRAVWTLSISFSVSAFVQYNSLADFVITNIRFRYNPREGNDLYLVYDEGLNRNRFREIPVLPGTSNRTLLLKYTYTFDF